MKCSYSRSRSWYETYWECIYFIYGGLLAVSFLNSPKRTDYMVSGLPLPIGHSIVATYINFIWFYLIVFLCSITIDYKLSLFNTTIVVFSFFAFTCWGVINASFLYLVDRGLFCLVTLGVVTVAGDFTSRLSLILVLVGVFLGILFLLKLDYRGLTFFSFILTANCLFLTLNLFSFSLYLLLNSLMLEK